MLSYIRGVSLQASVTIFLMIFRGSSYIYIYIYIYNWAVLRFEELALGQKALQVSFIPKFRNISQLQLMNRKKKQQHKTH